MIAIRVALGEGETPILQAKSAALRFSSYLGGLLTRHSDWLRGAGSGFITDVMTSLIQDVRDASAMDKESAVRGLRIAKTRMHLALALGDLARTTTDDQVTQVLTAFADASVQAALAIAERQLRESGDLVAPIQGLSVFAMGKHGARELNYSSDVDLIVFFSPNWIRPGVRLDAREAAVKLTQGLVRVLQEVTPDGYVFRTDLRLRPDPNATPVAVSYAAAERYYQSVGENWERAAFIKARVCAGDIEMGEAFLATLQPFIWRRHLDYAAIDDIRAVQRQIRRFHGSAPLDQAAFDVKLGRGGIRDIELFVQGQQLIRGGRDPSLRNPDTTGGLRRLAAVGVLTNADAETLVRAYWTWRAIEHRIQMRDDEQTHQLPASEEARSAVAALCGYADLSRFDDDVIALRGVVSELCDILAPTPVSTAAAIPDVDGPSLIGSVGFSAPDKVQAIVQHWNAGGVRALRAPRARALLQQLLPALLAACRDSTRPDDAFGGFALLMDRLPAGVQSLSLLAARPDVLHLLVQAIAIAPSLVERLSQHTTLLDAMGEPRFLSPIGRETLGQQQRALQAIVGEETAFEATMNAVRRYHREESFRITVQLLRQLSGAKSAGVAFAELADACVAAIGEASLREVERQFGRAPGRHVVVALGKFAGGELSANSDLDLMIVYDALEGARSDGERSLSAGDFYARFAQRMITGLSAPTEEGTLYKVDVQLRPSGSKGPVAVRLSSFERYYAKEAWIWELQALSRLRCAIGDAVLTKQVQDSARAALCAPRDVETTLAEVAAMRGRMQREKVHGGVWDVKLASGGLVDVEFIAQGLALVSPERAAFLPSPSTLHTLAQLRRCAMLDSAEEQSLREAFELYTDVQQVLRAAAVNPTDIRSAPPALGQLLENVTGVARLDGIESLLEHHRKTVRDIFVRRIGDPGDGTTPLRR